MIEGLFVLTTIFVAYVIYAIIGEQKATAKSKASAVTSKVQAAEQQPKPEVAVAKEKAKPATAKPTTAKTVTPKVVAKTATPTVTPKATVKSDTPKAAKAKSAVTQATTAKAEAPIAAVKSAGLKDPKTGEVVTTYSNYRFIKRWIKDALVAEGLLEQVYTANQLNAETDAKIKQAIEKLEAMDKYKA